MYAAALCAGGGLAELVAPAPHRTLSATIVRSRALAAVARSTERPAAATEPAPAPVEDVSSDKLPAPPELQPLNPLGDELRDGMIISGATEQRMILFTFDDGPDVRTTPLLLDRLDAAGVKAVFFLTASRLSDDTPILRQQMALAREIVERGHMVGNHTVNHVQMPLLDDEAAQQELLRSEHIFEQVFGARSWIFRPPFGAHSERIDFYVAARNYTTVLWNLGAGDFQVRSAQEVFELWQRVFERREREYGDRGGIILLHDTYPWSVDAFQLIHAHLLDRNCELLARGEELFDIVDDPRFFFVPRGDAPPSAVAPPAEMPPAVFEARQAQLREETRQRCRSLATL